MNIIPLRTQMATTSLFGNERDKVTFARKQAFIAQLMTHCFNVPNLWRLKKVRASARVHYVRLAALTHHGAARSRTGGRVQVGGSAHLGQRSSCRTSPGKGVMVD